MIKMHTLPVYDHAYSFRWNKKDYRLEDGELGCLDNRTHSYEKVEEPKERHRDAVLHGILWCKFQLHVPDSITAEALATEVFTMANRVRTKGSRFASGLYGLHIIGDDNQFILQAHSTGPFGQPDVCVYERRVMREPMKPVRQKVTDRMDVFDALVRWAESMLASADSVRPAEVHAKRAQKIRAADGTRQTS